MGTRRLDTCRCLDRADHHRGSGDRLHRLSGISPTGWDHGRPRRRAVVHQLRQRLDRADHHRGRRHQLHRSRHRRSRVRSPPAPTAPCGSPTPATTRSGGSPPPGVVTNYTGTGISAPVRSRPAPTAPCGSPTTPQQLHRADHHRRGRHQLHRSRHQLPGRDHGRPRRRPVVHQPAGNATRSGGSPPPGVVTNYTDPSIDDPWDHGRTRRRAVVHQHRQRLDRADHTVSCLHML